MKKNVCLLITLFILAISFFICPMEPEQEQFFEAVKKDDTKAVKDLLISDLVSINLQDNDGNTALMIAIKNQKTAMVNELLMWMQDFSLQNKNGQTALMLAIDAKNIDFVNKILDALEKQKKINQSINQQDAEGNTALMLALKNQNMEMVDALLKFNPHIELANNKGQTTLMLAIDTNNVNFVNKILDASPTLDIDEVDTANNPALIYAIKTNNIDIIKSILTEVPNIYQGEGGKEAKAFAKTEEIKKLLEKAEAQYLLWLIIHRFIDGSTDDPSSYIEGHISQGASLNVPSARRNPLATAIGELHDKTVLELQKKLVKLLLQKGADINLLLRNGDTPLTIAVRYSMPEIIRVLLESGQNINGEDRHHMTPLMVAAVQGRIPAIKLFLDANAAMKNSLGYHVIDVAEAQFDPDVDKAKQTEVIKLLKDKEAEISGKKIPVKPSISPDQLLSSLQKLVQSLRILQTKLTSK